MANPVVSVIIPSYNREKLILKAIDSVMKQSFQDFEILVIDDASTDDTEAVISNLKNDKIRYFKLDKNSGQCVARNYGITKVKGKYVGFLDSDDEWLPDKLKLQVECFEKGSDKLGAVYGYSYSKDVLKDETTLISPRYYRGNIHDKFKVGFCPPTPSLFLVKKEALEKTNGFDEKLLTFVDLDMWLRISEHYEYDYVEEPIIIKYEQIGDQYVNNFEKRYKGRELFMNKWGQYLLQDNRSTYDTLRNHLNHAIVIPILEHPPKGIRKHIFKIIHLLIQARSPQFSLYSKAFMIMLFGPSIVPAIRNFKSKK